MPHYDIAIIGAGPAGSATASLLAERGFAVLLVDRAEFPRSKPCGEYVSPEARRLLDKLLEPGTLESEQPALLDGMRVVSPNGTSFKGHFTSAERFDAYSDRGIALPRAILDHHLVQAAQRRGVTMFERTALVSLDQPTGATRALKLRQHRSQTNVTARLVVGADGLQSRVAKQLSLSRRGTLQRVALVTHALGVNGMGSVGEMHVTDSGYVGLAPVGRGLTNVSVVADRRFVRGKSTEWFQRVISETPEVQRRLARAEYVAPQRGAGPFASRSRRASAERAVLVGDAADFYDPFTGEGVYAALRGADMLTAIVANLLESDRLGAADLAAYDRSRRREFSGKWMLERIIAWAVGHPFALDHVARRLKTKPHLADLLVGVTGDFVPARQVLRPGFTLQMVW
jgi:geranylgeranyl reductase family protein